LNLVEKTKMTTFFEFQLKENGYLGRCPELSAVAWGKTLTEAKSELLDAVIGDVEKRKSAYNCEVLILFDKRQTGELPTHEFVVIKSIFPAQ